MMKLQTIAVGATLTYLANAGLHVADYHEKSASKAEKVEATLTEGTDVGNGRKITKVKDSQYTTKQAKKLREAMVEDKDCSRLCLFKNDNNSWCFATTPPMITVGWNWDNQFAESNNTYNSSYEAVKFYQWVLQPYAEVQAYLQSLYDIEMLFYNELSASLRKFQASTWFSLILNGNFQYCGGLGFGTEIIELEVVLGLKFIDCYKVILKDLCDFTTVWTGYEAKWLDECDQGQGAPIDLYTWDISEQRAWQPIMGTIWPVSAEYCKNLPLLGRWQPTSTVETPVEKFAKFAYSRVGQYLVATKRDKIFW